MRRREFITVFGGAAAAWPLAARAQQTALPVVGMLGGSSAAANASLLAGFREDLRDGSVACTNFGRSSQPLSSRPSRTPP